jgi:hypothetical protein
VTPSEADPHDSSPDMVSYRSIVPVFLEGFSGKRSDHRKRAGTSAGVVLYTVFVEVIMKEAKKSPTTKWTCGYQARKEWMSTGRTMPRSTCSRLS